MRDSQCQYRTKSRQQKQKQSFLSAFRETIRALSCTTKHVLGRETVLSKVYRLTDIVRISGSIKNRNGCAITSIIYSPPVVRRAGLRSTAHSSDEEIMAIQLSRRSWRSKGDETSYSEPELVGYYSVDSDGDYRPDSSQLSYYKDRNNVVSRFPIRDCDREQASVRIDLDRGRDSITRSSYSPAVGKLLFTWIKLNHEKIQAPTETGRW